MTTGVVSRLRPCRLQSRARRGPPHACDRHEVDEAGPEDKSQVRGVGRPKICPAPRGFRTTLFVQALTELGRVWPCSWGLRANIGQGRILWQSGLPPDSSHLVCPWAWNSSCTVRALSSFGFMRPTEAHENQVASGPRGLAAVMGPMGQQRLRTMTLGQRAQRRSAATPHGCRPSQARPPHPLRRR